MTLRKLIACYIFGFLSIGLRAQVYDQSEPLNPMLGKSDAFVLESDIGVYYPQQLEEQAAWLSQCARYVLSELEGVLDYRLNGVIEIYLSDMRQGHNTGSYLLKALQRSYPGLSGGIAEVNHKQVAIQFSGSYPQLYADLRVQVANILVNELIFGVSVSEKVRNTANIHFPQWFEFGLKAYMAEGWTDQDDQRYRDQLLALNHAILNNKKVPGYMHKALWHFITETKGTNGLSRFVYLSRLTKSIQSSLYFVFNLSYSEFIRDAEQWHLKRYLSEKRAVVPGRLTALPTALDEATITDLVIFGDTVWISLLKDQKAELWRFFEGGKWKREDKVRSRVPVLFFQLKGDIFALYAKSEGYEVRSLNNAFIPTEWQKFFNQFTRIVDVCADEQGNLWCSGFSDGPFTDVYLLQPGSETVQYTFDAHEETSLSIGINKELYLVQKRVSLKSHGPVLTYNVVQITDTLNKVLIELQGSEINEIHYEQTNGTLYFLSELSGTKNAYALGKDSGSINALTDYAHNLEFQAFDPLNRQVAEILHIKGKWVLSVSGYDAKENLKSSPRLSIWKQTQNQRRNSGLNHKPQFVMKSDRLLVPDTLKFRFQSDFPQTEHDTELKFQKHKNEAAPYRTTVKRPAMSAKEVYTRFDHGLLDIKRQSLLLSPALNYRYGLKLMGGGFWTDPSLRRQFTMVLRVETQLTGSDQLFRYQEYLGRFYLGSELYRQMYRNGQFLQGYERYNTLQLSTYGGVNIGLRSKIECTVLGRHDGRFNLVTDQSSLNDEDISNIRRLMIQFEFKNKLVDQGGRLRHAVNLFAHAGYAVGKSNPGHIAEFGLSAQKQFFKGANFRFLFQAESVLSVGNKKTVFVMGGVANWVNQQYNSDIEMLLTDAVAFSVVPGLRGTLQNSRNGNAYANIQCEGDLRIVSWLSEREVLNPSLRNLRLGLFADAGTAWYGKGPYDAKNPFFISRISAPGIDINLYQRRNPFLISAGWLLQVPVYRYQLQFSSGRALEDNELQERVFSFAIGYVF